MSHWHAHTQGGASGHRLRRAIHLSLFVLPILYWLFGQEAASFIGLSRQWLLILLGLVMIVLELFRLYKGRVVFAQRMHEKGQLSSFFWGGISIVLVLLFAGGPAYYIPIITVCAWVDPLLGELRTRQFGSVFVFVSGILLALVIWVFGYLFLGSPLILGVACSLLAVFFERFNWRLIDDNALMQLAPLLFLLLYRVLL